MKYINEFKEYKGKIVLEVSLASGGMLSILSAEVFHCSWCSCTLSLGYIMQSPTIMSSSCLGGYEDAGDIINLQQEAYTLFNLKETCVAELKMLGYIKENK